MEAIKVLQNHNTGIVLCKEIKHSYPALYVISTETQVLKQTKDLEEAERFYFTSLIDQKYTKNYDNDN